MNTTIHTYVRTSALPRYVLAGCIAAALTACGGGGGGGSATVGTSTTTTPVAQTAAQASTINNSAPSTPTYAAGSEELKAFNVLNAERTKCGFGSLAQNVKLDAAALAHANYLKINMPKGAPFGHTEDLVNYPTGFTGTSPGERVNAAGYMPLGVGENATGIFTTPAGLDSWSVRDLLSGPFHLRSMMGIYREVGIGIQQVTTTAGASVFDLGVPTSSSIQDQASDEVLTYPCEGSNNVVAALYGETPSPLPSRDLQRIPLGAPIFIRVRVGNTLVISDATMRNTATNTAVVLRSAAQTKLDSPVYSNYFGNNEAYVIPDAKLELNTSYTVTVTGTNNGVAFTRTFTFKTTSVLV